MRVVSCFALLISLTRIAHADADKDRLRALVRLPEMSLVASFGFTHNTGFGLSCGAPTPDPTPEGLQKRLTGTDSDASILDLLGNIYKERQMAAEAAAAWEKSILLDRQALKAKPNDAKTLARLAMALHQLKRKSDRDTVIADAVARLPKSAAIWDARAELAMADAVEALTGTMADHWSGLTPPGMEAALRGNPSADQAAKALKLLDEARADYDRAVVEEPGNPRPYAERTLLRAAFKFDSGLIDLYVKQKSLSPDEISTAEGEFHRSLFQPDSIRDAVKAAELSPSDPFALGMAGFFVMFGEVEQRKLTPDLSHGGGMDLLSEPNKKLERDLMGRIEKLTHSADRDLAGKSALAMGAVQLFIVSPEAAGAMLKRAIELMPADPRATEILFSTYIASKNLPAMKQLMEEGLKRSDTARWRLLLAKVAAKQNDWARAEAEARAAIKDDPASFDANLALCAVMLHSAKTETELRAAGEQLMKAQKVAAPSPTQEQYFSFNFTAAIFHALADQNAEARAKLAELQGRLDANETADVKELLALLPVL